MKKLIYLLVAVTTTVSAQTSLVVDINSSGSSNPSLLSNANGTIYFSADDGTTGEALWKFDGATASLVKDIRTGGNGAPANITRLLPVGSSVFFRANDDSNGKEPWFSDGTELGTNMILDINSSGSSFPNNYINVGGTVYFLANDGTNGAELWTSDGTGGGTSMVADINPGSGSSNVQNLVEMAGFVYFTATDGSTGFELWRSDGSGGGTTQVLDIQSGAANGFPKFLENVNGTLFFQADDGTNGIELWTSDGTGGGTSLVTNINPSGSAFIRHITNLNGSAIFQADDGSSGAELWISDGTALGTTQIADINSGAGASTPENFIVSGGVLYFTADDGVNGLELWRSDGTPGGTNIVADINPAGSSNPDNLTDLNGALYFSATDGVNGVELWKTDGTSGGTLMVDDINPAGDSNPNHFALLNDELYFSADDGTNGIELHKTDFAQASNLTVGAVTATTIDLSWTNGSGTRRMVIAREGAATYREPVDGIEYTANNAFGSGSNIGGAHYVVYDGTGESVTVTDFDLTTTYYFTVFEYLGTGNEINYITINKENIPGTTAGVSEPTTIASNLVFSNINENSVDISWDNTGDGTSRLVVAREGAAVTRVPEDGVTYASSNVFNGGGANLGGGQYVVYNSTGNSFTMSGLKNSTTYHIAVYEYNGGAGTENYLTSSSLTGNVTTNSPPAAEPTTIASNMTFSEINSTSFRVTWDNTGDGANRIVVARKGAAVTKVPSDGVTYASSNVFDGGGANLGGKQYVVFNGAGNTFVLSGLEFSTTYHLAVFEYNGTGSNTNYLTSISLTGSQATSGTSEPTTIASNMTFGTITTSSIEIMWDNTGNGARRMVVAREGAAVTKKPQDGVTYVANNTFAGGGSNLGGRQYVVYDGTGNTFNMTGLNSSTTYHLAVYEYNGSSGSENYLTSSFLTGSSSTSPGPMTRIASGQTGFNFNQNIENVWGDFTVSHFDSNSLQVTINGQIEEYSLIVYDLQGKVLYESFNINTRAVMLEKNTFSLDKMYLFRVKDGVTDKVKKYVIK